LDNQFKIYPLGDSAAILDFGNTISVAFNQKVLAIQNTMKKSPFQGLKDIIVAYSSLTLYYDPLSVRKHYNPPGTVFSWVSQQLQEAFEQSPLESASNGHITRIPVCYDEEFGTDLSRIVSEKKISAQEIIEIHTSRVYRVYMIGFLPGFPYMGEIDERISLKRKPQPVQVQAGSVGIVAMQTGIYPLNCPGGWNIIGRTPVKLFEPSASNPVKLKAGEQVQFYKISREEFDTSFSNFQIV
jgi:inhibitor of KinA